SALAHSCVGAGSDNLSRLRAGVRGSSGNWDYTLAVADLQTDGVSAASEAAGNTEDDPWENLTVSGRFGRSFLEDGRVDLAVRYTDGDNDIDGFTFGVGPSDDLNSEQARETVTAGLTVTAPIRSWWTQTFYVGAGSDELIGTDPDDFFSNFDITSETGEISTQAELALSDNDTLTVGYRVEKREAENVGSFTESLYLRSFFAENQWSLQDRHHFTVSLRHDDHSVFGSETTYRVTSSLKLAENTRFHGSFGTGFKAPTFNDLYFPGFGNPDLAPETSEGFDLGLEQTLLDGRLTLDLTYFDNDFEDLILFTFPAGFVNVATATSEGFEFSARWEPTDQVLLQASHTYNETEDGDTGLQLARRPEHRSAFYLAFDATDRLRGTASLIMVRDRIDSDGSDADDYERLDLSLDYRATRLLKPYLRLENVLDEDYSEVPGFTSPGFTAAVGLSVGL
ncbi:MAG: TonB-dependent receptor, partial [Acidobacteriota bacterium]